MYKLKRFVFEALCKIIYICDVMKINCTNFIKKEKKNDLSKVT